MKKLKQQYRSQDKAYGHYLWDVYPIKLRAARGKTLAVPWDDYPACVYDVAKCWKHNSKRRHQYYK
ncbi:hypothetical protein CGH87_23495 [Vibrio parahaemolyticus]|uniref:hypothetical protein n=1 Tax=Vibrio TaxID=662 RepID=UPI0004A4BEF0|nr:hypothetical protein [Vibrio sp. Vb1574]EGR3302662.1 hypothetical protein [Vibrio parahaemolyticus]HCZ9266950.1 hypothetical protein [Vibrio alginolyticus]EGR3319725.1 hypothetical protein [Vibrio parahaemolyticus]KHF06614.1 hypothetical protein PO77_14120 [Vibrio parahaemolyticus]MDW1887596.1 hypothetical protein [Vibrio sp. Vb1574]